MTSKNTSDKNPSSVGGACCAVALSLMLAGQWPAESVAYAVDSYGAGAADVAATSQEVSGAAEVDNAAVTDVSADWGRAGLTLSKGGRYTLSADVKDAGTLFLSAPKGETIELDLAGHTVQFADGVTCGIDLSESEGAVRIVNSKPAYRAGAQEKTADNLTPSLTLFAIDPAENVFAVRDDAEKRQAGQDAPRVSLENIAIDVSVHVSEPGALSRDVAGVYAATRGVGVNAAAEAGLAARLDGAGEGLPTDDVDVSLSGCSIAVSVDALGDAARDALSIGSDDQGETGMACALFTACAGVSLDGSLNLSATGLGGEADIASSVGDAFAFGRDFKNTQALRANAKGNAAGTILGHVSDDFDLAKADGLAFSPACGDVSFALRERNVVTCANEASSDGTGEGGASEPAGAAGRDVADASGSASGLITSDPVLAASEAQAVALASAGAIGRRALEREIEPADVTDERIVATLVRGDKMKGSFATVDDALAQMATGDTLRLEADVDAITFAKGGNALVSYTIDLAGHTASQVNVTSQAKVGIISSSEGGAIGGPNLSGSALSYSGSGQLSVEGVKVTSSSGGVKACGISITGTGYVSLTDVDVSVSAQSLEARGINQTAKNGGAVVIVGGSVSVSTQAASVAAYGITTSATSKTLSLEDCPVSVIGTTAAACAIDSKGIVSVKGTSSQVEVSVSATTATANTRGIRATSSSSSIRLSNCDVSVNAQNVPQGVQAWCVTTGDETTQNEASIALDGACSFFSCTDTDISLYKAPLQLGESFDPGTRKVSLLTRGLANDVFATCSGSSADASAFAGSFRPVSGSAYEGWSAQVAQTSSAKLAWHHETVVRNATSGEEYGSFSQAVASAKSGDTLVLASDATVSGALCVSQRDLAINLDSHTLTVNAAGEAAGTSSLAGGGIAFSGAGALSLSGGSVNICVGRSVETSVTASNPYQGFVVSGGGAIRLSQCAATVEYAGSTSTKPQVTLYGASNASGTFELSDASVLTVRASRATGDFGASTVCGLYGAGSEQADSLIVDSTSKVVVENNAGAIVQGQIAYPDGALSGTGSSTNADLIEFSVDPSDALYEEIQQQFKKVAKFDSSLDEAGEVFDTGIYYASSMKLPSGLVVWAFSDPVPSDSAGRLDAVKATHFFVRANYQVPLNAYGASAATAYAGSFAVEGNVSAATTQGHAFGSYVPDGASWSIDDGGLSATATGDAYRIATGNFDLARHVEFGKTVSRAVVYPDDASYREVVSVKPQAAKTAFAGSVVEDEISGGVTYSDLFSSMNNQVKVTFSNIRSTAGDAHSQDVMVERGKTLSASGASAPSPSDYTAGDVTYRFIGWRLSSAGSSSYAYDPEAFARDIAIDANLSGVSEGSVELSAVYVPVKSGQHLVKFRIEYGVYAMAANAGSHPTYAGCTGRTAEPSRLTSVSDSAYKVEFKGWACDDSGAYAFKDGETVYASELPAVDGDVTYSARFTSKLVKTTVGLYYLRQTTDGSYSYMGETIKDVDWTHDLIETADTRAKVGSTITQNGISYTLLGWSPRVSDKEPLYVDSIPLAYDGDMLSSKPLLYAVYRQVEKTYHVNFYVNGALYSTASGIPASMTLYNAWNASSNAVEPVSATEGETFKGWNSDAKASTYFRASIKKMGEIAASSEGNEIDLYAIWSSATDKPSGDDPAPAPDDPATPTAPSAPDDADGGDSDTGSNKTTASLPSANASGATLASALKSSAGADGADGEAADDADGVATLFAQDASQQGPSDDADGGSDAQEAEDASNAAGVVGVIVAALAAVGAVIWWFFRRRTGDDLEGEDDLPAPEEGADAQGAKESIRF